MEADRWLAAPGDQFFPWIAVDGSGRYHAIWFDTGNDPANRMIETFQALSTDGGATWGWRLPTR